MQSLTDNASLPDTSNDADIGDGRAVSPFTLSIKTNAAAARFGIRLDVNTFVTAAAG